MANASVDEIIAIGKQKGIDMSKYEAKLRQKFGQTGIPTDTFGQQPQQVTQQDPSQVASILKSLQLSPMQSVGNAMSVLGGGKPIYEQGGNDISKLYAQEAVKKQFEEPNYVVSYDSNNQPIFNKAPGTIKNAPFYASPMGGQYYQAKTGQAEAQGQQAKTETDIMNDVKGKLGAGGVEGVTPGTTVQAGPYNIPLNPKLTESEQGTIGGVQGMEPLLGQIEKSLNSGVLESPMGNVGRTINQFLADRQSALFTANNPKLQDLQSQLNALKKTIPFTEGGKQLTDTEKAMVMALLDITGKPNDRIMGDLNQAMQILRAKEKLALGGRNAALQGQQPAQQTQSRSEYETMSDEELHKIASGQ